MIAVDTQVLVYAHRADSPWHAEARDRLVALAESGRAWAIPWACVHEFISIVTHPRLYDPPSTLDQAFDAIDAWRGSEALVLIGEGADHLDRLRTLATRGKVKGPTIHDARIAAICLAHGVDALWTLDRDFTRFPGLRTQNPLA